MTMTNYQRSELRKLADWVDDLLELDADMGMDNATPAVLKLQGEMARYFPAAGEKPEEMLWLDWVNQFTYKPAVK